jgi:hypothetical protein
MISLCHCWGWQPSQTASLIHVRHIQSVGPHWYAAHRHMVAALHSYTHTTCWLRFCGVLGHLSTPMISLCHCWGWQSSQRGFLIHVRHIQSVGPHWYAVHRHMEAALYSSTHTTWLIFWCSGLHVESKWCHYVMVEVDSHLKLHPPSILDIYNEVFEHIDMLPIGIW